MNKQNNLISKSLIAKVLASSLPTTLTATPTATDDPGYSTTASTLLTTPAPGVLTNDQANRPIDSDSDGYMDSEENTLGSDPNNPNSIPAIGINVSNNAELVTAASSATAGSIIIIEDGIYNNLSLTVTNSGTAINPIIIRSKNVGGASIQGISKIILSGNHIIIDGVTFTNGRPGDSQGAIRFNGNHNRVTNCSIIDYNGSTGSFDGDWIGMNGTFNRVDHCKFTDKVGVGPLLVVWHNSGVEDNHQIDNNIFKNYASGGGANGYETIRIGTSNSSQSNSSTTVEFNYFEACDGEIEIISNKSGNNTFRGNTFIDCDGLLTLRHGTGALVEDNVFINLTKGGAGGIRIIDKDHIIRNNYIEGITTGSSSRGGIVFATAIANSPLNGYWLVENIEVSNNSVINSRQSFLFGSNGKPLPTESVNFTDNIARNDIAGSGQHDLIRQIVPINNPTYSGNLFFGSPLGISPTPAGIDTTTDPNLTQNAQGLWLHSGGKGAQNINKLSESDCGPRSRSPLTVALVTGVGADGNLLLNPNGSFSYTPANGFSGQTQFTYVIIDGGVSSNSTATATINVTPATAYDIWSQQTFTNNFLNKASNIDFDGDKLTNLQEFAFGLDPTSAINTNLSFIEAGNITQLGTPIILENGGNFLGVFSRRKDFASAGLTYTASFSADLILWTDSTTTPSLRTSPTNPGDYEAVSIPLPNNVPVNASSTPEKPQFFRIRLNQN